jgi:hypothetical protein
MHWCVVFRLRLLPIPRQSHLILCKLSGLLCGCTPALRVAGVTDHTAGTPRAPLPPLLLPWLASARVWLCARVLPAPRVAMMATSQGLVAR